MSKIETFIKRGILCAKCGYVKFKTIIKGKKWSCRMCGAIKE